MNNIAIIGAGGFGRETLLAIHQINQDYERWNVLGFFDDGLKIDNRVDGCLILGGIMELNTWNGKLNSVIAIGNPLVKKRVFESINNTYISFPKIIHPSVSYGPLSGSCEGLIIGANSSITSNVSIGRQVAINLNCTIGHDCTIGDFCSIMPGVNISGDVNIGPGSYIGTGAKILPGISIGHNAIVGAGAVVTCDVESGAKVVGVPAKPK